MATPDVPRACHGCDNLESIGDHMVGTDETGGGPEEFFKCSEGWNLSRLYYRAYRGLSHDCTDCTDRDSY